MLVGRHEVDAFQRKAVLARPAFKPTYVSNSTPTMDANLASSLYDELYNMYELNHEQAKILKWWQDALETNAPPIAYTGKGRQRMHNMNRVSTSSSSNKRVKHLYTNADAGTGKSHVVWVPFSVLIFFVRKRNPKNATLLAYYGWAKHKTIIVLSPLGFGASHLPFGVTFHSLVGLDIGTEMFTYEDLKPAVRFMLQSAHGFIIDETQSMDGKLWQCFSEALNDARQRNGAIFGDVPVFMCGDVQQKLRIIPGADKIERLDRLIFATPLWKDIDVFALVHNNRIQDSQKTIWLKQVASGTLTGRIDIPDFYEYHFFTSEDEGDLACATLAFPEIMCTSPSKTEDSLNTTVWNTCGIGTRLNRTCRTINDITVSGGR